MMRGLRELYSYVVMSARIVFLVIIALSVPKIGVLYVQSKVHAAAAEPYVKFKFGIENITSEALRSFTPKGDLSYSVGLVTNQTGRDQLGQRTIDILLKHGVNIKKIFTPEHGFDGLIQDHTTAVPVLVDPHTKIPVVTLYDKWTTKSLDKKMLQDIDVIMFDIQEVGMRHNTYLTTLFQSLEAAAAHKKTVVVFDRPNVLGSGMEGPLVDASLKSAISYASIPVRHGMTVGELASYFNTYCLHKKVALHVVPMENYNRYQSLEHVEFSRFTPNIASINACYGYSFLGLLAEVRPFDVAVGTDKAFQCITLPDSIKFSQKKWCELHELLKDHGIEGKFHRYFSTRKKQHCSGLLVRIPNMNTVSSFKSLLAILTFFKKSGVKLEFSRTFDKAIGSTKVREFLEGSLSKYELELAVNDYLHDFFNKATHVFKYRPYPYLMKL